MVLSALDLDLVSLFSLLGTLCQMATASVAVLIGIVTFRYTKRQNALNLISHNNGFANAVNSTVIASAEARAAWSRLQDPILGSPDDAVMFMYLNYVHNTFRMRKIGAVSQSAWRDTLAACVRTLRRIGSAEVDAFLSRGYEPGFRAAILAGLAVPAPSAGGNVLPLTRDAARPLAA